MSASNCDHPPACPAECTHCLAYDRFTRSLCSLAPASVGSKWCAIHEELQAKALKNYKRHTHAVESFSPSLLPASHESIQSERSLTRLREWSATTRVKWGLVQRVIVHRKEHHDQFYAGGDWGHCLFVETMQRERGRLEEMMRLLDKRAYAITLAESRAEWILSARAPAFICDEPLPSTKISMPPTPPTTPPLATQELPSQEGTASSLSKSQRKARARKARKNSATASMEDSLCCGGEDRATRHLTTEDQLARLRAYLVPPAFLPVSIREETWHGLVESLFRYAILRVPSLAPLALSSSSAGTDEPTAPPSSVEAFLDLLEERTKEMCGEEVGRLWKALKFARTADEPPEEGLLSVGVFGDCLADVFRTGDELQAQHVKLLGGRAYKEPSTADLPAEGWDLFYQFIACSGCSITVTRTFASWVRNRRLAALGAYPAWQSAHESGPEHIFRLAGALLCGTNSATCGRKLRRVEQQHTHKGGCKKKGCAAKAPVLVEEWERAWMYLKLRLDDPWANEALDFIQSQPGSFALLARNARTGQVTHSPAGEAKTSTCRNPHCKDCPPNESLWLSRVRSGLSPLARRTATWTTSTYFPLKSVLDSFSSHNSPERRFGHEFKDVWDVLIVDERSYEAGVDWDTFLNAVGEAFVRAKGFTDPQSLLQEERRSALASGEMSLPRGKRQVWVGTDCDGQGVVYAKREDALHPREMFRELN